MLNRKRGEGKRRPWKEVASEKPNEAETRVMDSACWIQAKEDQAVMIVLACSDARLRLLLWESEKLTLQDEAVAGEHCLLQVEFCSCRIHVVYIPIAGGKVRRHINSGDGQHRRGSDGLGSSQRSAAHVFGKAEDPPVGSKLSSG